MSETSFPREKEKIVRDFPTREEGLWDLRTYCTSTYVRGEQTYREDSTMMDRTKKQYSGRLIERTINRQNDRQINQTDNRLTAFVILGCVFDVFYGSIVSYNMTKKNYY